MPTLTPYAELLKLTKEQREERTFETRIKRMRKAGELQLSELEEKLAKEEDELVRLCSSTELSFSAILDCQDRLALLERRRTQFSQTLAQLFPSETVSA